MGTTLGGLHGAVEHHLQRGVGSQQNRPPGLPERPVRVCRVLRYRVVTGVPLVGAAPAAFSRRTAVRL